VDKQGILSRLLKIQEELRNRLIAELSQEGDELQEVFSPGSFSNKYEVYRYKYTERLDTLNRIIAEIQRSQAGRPTFKVTSVEAASREDLIPLVNKRLEKLRPGAVANMAVFRDPAANMWVAILVCGY